MASQARSRYVSNVDVFYIIHQLVWPLMEFYRFLQEWFRIYDQTVMLDCSCTELGEQKHSTTNNTKPSCNQGVHSCYRNRNISCYRSDTEMALYDKFLFWLAFSTEEIRNIVPFWYHFYTKVCFCSCSSCIHLLVLMICGFLGPFCSWELNSTVCRPHL